MCLDTVCLASLNARVFLKCFLLVLFFGDSEERSES